MTMRVYKTRPLAIRAACEMFRDNNDEELSSWPNAGQPAGLERRRASPDLRDYPGRTARPHMNSANSTVVLPHPGLTVF
jgi:hypothetical protein